MHQMTSELPDAFRDDSSDDEDDHMNVKGTEVLVAYYYFTAL